jgi:hypothetical protein
MTFSITTLSLKGLFVTLCIKYTQQMRHHVKTERRILFIVMLNVIMLYVVMMSVVAPFHPCLLKQRKSYKRTSLLWMN